MYKVFPATLIQDSPDKSPRKVPLIKGWKERATTNPVTQQEWQAEHGERIKFWAVPTGMSNNLLVLDVDVKGGGLETVKKYQIPTTTTQKTMSGGTHYLFKYPNDGKIYGNRVGFDSGLDIRGEGGYIAYYGVDSTPAAEAPAWLLEQALNKPKELVKLEDAVRVCPEIVKSILDNAVSEIIDAPDGESNNVLNVKSFEVGQLITSGSIDKDYAYNELFKAAKLRGKPDYEAQATITSGLEGGTKKPLTSPFGNSKPELTCPIIKPPEPVRWTPKFFTEYDLKNQSKLRKPQLFKDWSTEDIHLTTADGGTGKTTLKLCEAISLALGERFLGFECKAPGRTLYITGEDTEDKLGAMIGAIMRQMGLFEDTPENKEKVLKIRTSIVVKKDSDLCLIAKTKENFLAANGEAMKKVMEAVEDIRPKLIVFDPIASFWGSESAVNDMSKAVSKFMSALVERSNACVDMINHMGKASSTNKDMSQFAGRGGSGLPSHSRVSRVLRPLFDDEYTEMTGMILNDGESAMLCNVNKFSDGSPLYNKPFVILRNNYLFSRVILTEGKVKEEQEKMSDMERVFTFIKGERINKKHPTKDVIIGSIMYSGDKISKDRVSKAISLLTYTGHMGEKIKAIQNPDIEVGGKVYIITDNQGKELH